MYLGQGYETAQSANRMDELKTYIPPRNLSLKGTSSLINLFLDRDSRPGHDTNPDADHSGPDRATPPRAANGSP